MFKNPVFRRFIKRPASVIGGIVLIIFFLTALFGPLLCRTDPNAINPDICYQAPSTATTTMAKSSPGKASRMSMAREMTVSIHLPK